MPLAIFSKKPECMFIGKTYIQNLLKSFLSAVEYSNGNLIFSFTDEDVNQVKKALSDSTVDEYIRSSKSIVTPEPFYQMVAQMTTVFYKGASSHRSSSSYKVDDRVEELVGGGFIVKDVIAIATFLLSAIILYVTIYKAHCEINKLVDEDDAKNFAYNVGASGVTLLSTFYEMIKGNALTNKESIIMKAIVNFVGKQLMDAASESSNCYVTFSDNTYFDSSLRLIQSYINWSNVSMCMQNVAASKISILSTNFSNLMIITRYSGMAVIASLGYAGARLKILPQDFLNVELFPIKRDKIEPATQEMRLVKQ
jgi:hypothetical protein